MWTTVTSDMKQPADYQFRRVTIDLGRRGYPARECLLPRPGRLSRWHWTFLQTARCVCGDRCLCPLVTLDHEPRDLFGHGNDDRPADFLLGLQPAESRAEWSSSGHVVHRVRRFWYASAVGGDR